jgi:hypothetical protein
MPESFHSGLDTHGYSVRVEFGDCRLSDELNKFCSSASSPKYTSKTLKRENAMLAALGAYPRSSPGYLCTARHRSHGQAQCRRLTKHA